MWEVKVIKGNYSHIYGFNYFPRQYKYKKDALIVQEKLSKLNVTAEIKKVKWYMLEMLEKLLSITEEYTEQMESEDREAWYDISAKVADLRERIEG